MVAHLTSGFHCTIWKSTPTYIESCTGKHKNRVMVGVCFVGEVVLVATLEKAKGSNLTHTAHTLEG